MANPLITNFDYSKLFIWNCRFKTVTYTNSTGSTVTLPKGRLMGRVFSNNKVLPQVSTAVDGSQVPIFVLQNEYVVANGSTVTLSVCYTGDVAREGVVFGGSDTFATVISLPDDAGTPNNTKIGTIEDILSGRGIQCPATSEHTQNDNQ